MLEACLASAQLSEHRKEKLTHDLTRFYRYNRSRFEKPNYRRIEKLPFIPCGRSRMLFDMTLDRSPPSRVKGSGRLCLDLETSSLKQAKFA